MDTLYSIEAENIFKEFEGVRVLENVSIFVPEGTIYGILGPNGAGKTTLIRILNRIFFPDSGRIRICGYDYYDFPPSIIGYLPEERGLYKKMKVGEHILFLLRIKGFKRPNLKKFVQEKMEEWGMVTWYNKRVEELSKGMQQKVQLLATILPCPQILILDEPFTGLDPINTRMIQEELIKLAKNGTTILLSTHDMASVEEICRYVCLINKGKKVLDGEVSKLKYYYRTNMYEMLLLFSNEPPMIEELLNGKARLLHKEEQPPFHYIKFQMNTDEDGMAVVTIFQQLEGVEIIKYNRILPSIRDIFFKKVQGGDE